MATVKKRMMKKKVAPTKKVATKKAPMMQAPPMMQPPMGGGAPMMKMGGKMAKQAAIAIAMKKAGKTPKKKMQYGGEAASMVPPMKKGGKMAKAQDGYKTLSNVTVDSPSMNRGKKTIQTSPGGAYKMKTTTDASGNTIKKVERRTLKGLISGAPKARGVMEQKFKAGGSLKAVPSDKVGLSKLPTPVRNKMGYAKKGATMNKAKAGAKMTKKCAYGCK